MSKCNNHPTTIPGYGGSLEELARAVENLRYDALAEFLEHLEWALMNRSLSDDRAGKEKLARRLLLASDRVTAAKYQIDEAWDICKPYMGNE